MDVLLSACAFIWHVGDAMLGSTKGNKKAKKFFAGVGVGWSALFLAVAAYRYYTQPRYTDTKPWEELV